LDFGSGGGCVFLFFCSGEAPRHSCAVWRRATAAKSNLFKLFPLFPLFWKKKGGVFHNRQAGALATCLLIYINIDIYPAIFWVPEPLIDKDLRV